MKDYAFIQHLEELRRRIIYCLLFIVAAAFISYPFINKILFFLAKPLGKMVFIQPVEAFVTYIKLALFCALFISLPFIIYQIWAFISPGLKKNEKRYALLFAPLGFLLFIIGCAFAYFVIIPFGIKFLLGFQSAWLVPMITVSSYITFFCIMILIFGCVFQLPVVILLLGKLGLIDPITLRRNRKYVILVIFVIAAIITPPDVITQIMISLPLILLYEISILLVSLLKS